MDSGSTRPQRKIAQISSKRPQLISALEAIANGRTDLPLDELDASAVAWAIQAASDRCCTAPCTKTLKAPSALIEVRKAADLTARIVMAEHFEAVGEIIDACRRSVPSLTLLKGISISEECYREPHLRLMRDVDLLIEKESLSTVKTTLQQLGYRQRSEGTAHYRTHHHAEPFFHEEKQVWVEVHHAFSRLTEELLAPGCLALKTSLLSYGHSGFKAGKSVASAWSCRSFTSPLTGHRTSLAWEVWWRWLTQFTS
jgi:hypothetical protein